MANYGLLDIMPENLLEDKHIRKITEVIDKTLKGIYPKASYPAIISRIDELDSDTIDLMAWQFNADFYDSNFSLNKRRILVRNAIRWHRQKGTKAAVEELLQAIYDSAKVSEWFEYGGEPYHFKVETVLDAEMELSNIGAYENIIKAIEAVKNVRSWLDGVLVYYPEIITKLTPNSSINVYHSVEAEQRIWNLGKASSTYWDGAYYFDGTIRHDGINPDEEWQERQNHKIVNCWLVEQKHTATYITNHYNVLNGSIELGGDRTLEDIYDVEKSMLRHDVSAELIVNGISQGAERV